MLRGLRAAAPAVHRSVSGGVARLELVGSGADSTRGKQRHEQTYHIHRDSCESGQDRSAGEYDGEFRKFLPCLWHGGKVAIERPRLRGFDGKEQALPSWEGATTEDWLGKWAMNQMLINVSTRKFKRSVRLPEGEVPAPKGSGLSKSAASRRFVALSAARLKEWMARDRARRPAVAAHS
jgi:hypothetical protein